MSPEPGTALGSVRHALCVALLASLVLLVAPAAATAAPAARQATAPASLVGMQDAYPPSPARGVIDKSSMSRGECAVFSGSGFQPGSQVTISDRGQVVATVPVATDGTFRYQVCYRDLSDCGDHRLTASGIDADGQPATVGVTTFVRCQGGGSAEGTTGGSAGGSTGGSTTAGTGGEAVSGPPRGGKIPFTGAEIGLALLVGALAIGAGWLFQRWGRRRTTPAAVR